MREVLKKVNLLGFLDTQNGLDTVLLEKAEIFQADNVRGLRSPGHFLRMPLCTLWMKPLPILMWKVKS